MRRAEPLIPYSREHHTTLKLVRHIQAMGSGVSTELPATLSTEFEQHRTDLARHFAGEETLLLPLLNQAGQTALAERLLAEHASLRQLLASPTTIQTLQQLAPLLEAHIRFEERELFPAIERLAWPA